MKGLTILILAAFFVLTPLASYADTHAAADCEYDTVTTAIAASSNGDTVTVADGACEWTNTNNVVINKEITLEGLSRPTITIDGDNNQNVVSITAANVTIKGFDFVQKDTSKPYPIGVSTGGDDFRITDNTSTGTTGYFIDVRNVYGLIDHNTITHTTGTAQPIVTRGPSTSYQTASSLGGPDNVFVEDNTFTDTNVGYTVCSADGRCVFRYNSLGASKFDAHGTRTSPPGVRNYEVYENDWRDKYGYFNGMDLRGGSGMVWGNAATHTSPTSTGIWLELDEQCARNTDCADYTPNCACTPPVEGQIGVGIDPIGRGDEPMYLWLNLRNAVNWPIITTILPQVCIDDCGTGSNISYMIANNTDYYEYDASFDGTSGTGSGVVASRPATCTAGVGYWATDESILYTCDVGDDAWTNYYEPYEYPHPLQQEGILQLSFDCSLESEVVTGGCVLTGDLDQDFLVATFAADNAITTAFIALLTGSGAEAKGIANYLVGLVTHAHVFQITSTQFEVRFPAAVDFDIMIPDDLGSSLCDTCTEGAVEIPGDSTYPLTVNPQSASVSPAGVGNNSAARSVDVNVNAKQIDTTP